MCPFAYAITAYMAVRFTVPTFIDLYFEIFYLFLSFISLMVFKVFLILVVYVSFLYSCDVAFTINPKIVIVIILKKYKLTYIIVPVIKRD